MSLSQFVIALLACAFVFAEVASHGMMLDPPNRSSLWRFDPSSPKNYDDNANYCGGFGNQWNVHNGRCGICGDNYGDRIPRANENTGKYGRGKVVAQYLSGSVINVTILLTTNHKGWFTYSICDLKNPSQPELDDCFQSLHFADGSQQMSIPSSAHYVFNLIRLPPQLTCRRCVLRWNYRAGNSWGNCGNGTSAVGCGPQETFRSCSDIAIV